jgi:hypothetical protein
MIALAYEDRCGGKICELDGRLRVAVRFSVIWNILLALRTPKKVIVSRFTSLALPHTI